MSAFNTKVTNLIALALIGFLSACTPPGENIPDAADGGTRNETPDGGETDGGHSDGGIDAGTSDDGGAGFEDAGWGGLTIDEPFTTDQIELVQTLTQGPYTVEFYRNIAYTCGVSGYQTFTVVYSTSVPLATERPLWVRMHGGGVGAFDVEGNYQPPALFDHLDQENIGLASQLQETGLMTNIRTHAAGFRFLMPSLCDHDLYSGVGVPELNNPYSPDPNGQPRAADGLLATRAAIDFTRNRVSTTHVFLHGTSAGSIGAFSVAYASERAGQRLTGIVMDSHVMSLAFEEIVHAGCTPYDTELVRKKVGPLTDSQHLPDRVLNEGRITVPIMQVWSRGDPSCCGETPFSYLDEMSVEQTIGSCEYHHRLFRDAIDASSGDSENLQVCVNGPNTTTAGVCNMHSPTKIAYTESTPVGDQDHGGEDYNARITDWVTARLGDPIP